MSTIDLWRAIAKQAEKEKNKKKVREKRERRRCLKEGQLINGYEIGQFCGKGGIGELRHAIHLETGEYRVLKYPKPGISAICNATRIFKNEARFLLELDHPNIVRGYEPFQHKGIIYIPMETLDNNAEAFFYTHRKLSKEYTSKLYFFMAHAAKALKYIHSRGVVHCDITPSQFMVHDDVVKLADLGSAKRTGEPTLIMMVTPGYSVKRFPSKIDPCLDMYAMGRTVARVLLPTTGLNYQQCCEIMRNENDKQILGRLRRAYVSEYLLGNIIQNCLESATPGKGMDAADLEEKVEMFGAIYDVQDRVQVRVDLYSGKRRTRVVPAYKILREQQPL